ncbi:MAG: hypothetical protein IJ318_01110, partial [Clostridia bacterium]|nr:hypothetical protein [Clostridia bacterium]
SAYPIVASMGAVTKPSNVKVTGSDPIKLETGAQNIEFTITLSLEKTGNAYNKIDMPASDDNLTITMDFSKYIAPEFTVNDDGELVTTMGHGTDADYTYANSPHEEEIEWFAFAVLGEGDTYTKPSFVTSSTVVTVGEQKWYSLTGATMTLDNAKNHTFWFIQRYVTAGGYHGDPNDTEFKSLITGQKFNALMSDGNDYDQSVIHEYLSGYAYQAATGITSGMLYDITKREVNETYITNYNSTAGTQENAFSSKLWLLNEAETALLGDLFVCGIGNTAGDYNGSVASWWLRSPNPNYAGGAHYVVGDGYLDHGIVNSSYGVRAAFEITMP